MGKVVQKSSRVHARVNAGRTSAHYSTQTLILYNIAEFQVIGGLGSADIGDLVTEGNILKIRLSDRLRGP